MTAATKPAAPLATVRPVAPRMTIAGVVKGKQQKPIRVTLYGVEGVGKSSFAASAPSPIFLGTEDGTAQLDVSRFQQPESWGDMLDAVRTLTEEPHDFKTLAVDTLDWAEPLLWGHICRRDDQQNIEAYGYGKGYQAAVDEWRIFIAALERMRSKRGMNVILLAHSWIKSFKNPEGLDFDRHEMKLHPKACGLLKEWCDVVVFANFETFATKDEKTKRVRGVSTGARLLYTTRTAAYDAKNRHDLPESLPLSWAEFAAALEAHVPADAGELRSEIERKAKQFGGPGAEKVPGLLAKAGDDAALLAKLNDWLNGKLALAAPNATTAE